MTELYKVSVSVLLFLGLGFDQKALDIVNQRKCSHLLQPGERALKPKSPQPAPHVERLLLVTGKATDAEQTV